MRLKQLFGLIITDIEENNKYLRYSLKLPSKDDNSGKSDGIPISSIVQTMTKDLNQSNLDRNSSLPDNINDNHIQKSKSVLSVGVTRIVSSYSGSLESQNSISQSSANINIIEPIEMLSTVDIFSLRFGDTIIDAFNCLYKKYIASISDYTINIKSNTRSDITSMFDPKFFSLWSSKQDLENDNNQTILTHQKSPSKTEISLWNRLTQQQLKQSITNTNNNKNNNTFFIKAQFEKYAQVHGHDITESDLLRWLLIKLIQAIEPAVFETTLLLSDSYSRFRRSNSKVFKKAVSLAIEHKRKQTEMCDV